jgi:hypothetical protein
MTAYTLSLSRWHKVSERLARAYGELTKSAHAALAETKVSGYLGETQVERLRAKAAEQLDALTLAFRLQDAQVSVRQAVGEANARLGINAELAEHDALTRRLRCLENLLGAQSAQMIALEELDKLPAPQLPQGRTWSGDDKSLPVRTLEAAAEADLRQEAQALRARLFALADRINDRNRERLTLELSEEAAQVVGL